jgi:DNA-binding beta-propeller fold protein YncE
MAFAEDGSLLFVEMNPGDRLRKIAPDGTLTTLAGTGQKGDSGDNGPALKAQLNGPHDLVVALDGAVLIADTFNHRVRRYDPFTKTIAAFAGTGKKGYAGDDGQSLTAQFDQLYALALDRTRNFLYVCDLGNRRVRSISASNSIIRSHAGNGQKGEPKDGEPAASQPLVDPRAIALDADGNLYLLERAGHRLRVVRPDGTIKTVAGTGKAGKGGDGGPALKAAFNGPKYLAVDKDGSVLIVDTENHLIRRYVPGKEVVELVAGSGKKGSAGVGGDPLKLELSRPHGVAVHPETGELYIADSDNGRILKITKE